MNNIEEFIKANRDQFDAKEPREKLWNQIETDLYSSKDDYRWLWKAAVVVLLAVCGYLIFERSQEKPFEGQLVSEFYVDPEFEETEHYYTELIAQKSKVVSEFNLEDAEIKNEFKKDISSLDTMYLELKQEFIETGNATVLDALIRNLQLRMELLDQELMILEKIENDNHDETSEIEYL